MMTRTHGMTGVAAWMTGDALTRMIDIQHHYYVTIAGALIAWGAAKIPDIDNPDSRPGMKLNKLVPGMSDAIESAFEHRGLTHWATTGVTLGAIIGLIAGQVHPSLWWIGLAVALGWTVHIAGDCCTYQGAPALGPVRTDPVRLPYGWRIECGGKIETETIYPLAVTWALAASMASVALAIFASGSIWTI